MRSFFLFLAPSASRAVFLSAVAFFLSGCQTNAQKQHSELRSSVDSASINVTACTKEVQSRPQFSTIVHRLSLTTESPSVDHFVDSSRPTPSDARNIASYATEIRPCRAMMVSGLTSISPTLPAIFSAYHRDIDIVYADLIQGRLTWGDANRQISAIRTASQQRAVTVAEQVDAKLAAQHDRESTDRQNALSGLAVAAQQMQARRSSRRGNDLPISTTCNRFGDTIDCTSR